ncbi:MAG: hypothetical protein IPO02_13980 [Bacteroidetes bacterium]|nr:hypothetical protein [Bacteroidota bacterium]
MLTEASLCTSKWLWIYPAGIGIAIDSGTSNGPGKTTAHFIITPSGV